MDYFLFNFSGVQFHYTMSLKNILHNTEAASNEKANFIDAAFVCSNSKRLQ